MLLADSYLGPKTFTRFLVNRDARRKAVTKALAVTVMLTPLVDCFSMLVIFLLNTFSASPQLAVVQKGVTLPSAATGRELKDAPVLSIAPEEIFLDQKLVGKVQDLLKNPTPLMERLGELRELWMKTHPTETFKGEITVQAHHEIASTTVSQVMGFLPSQHYGLIQLAVLTGTPGTPATTPGGAE